MMAEKPILFSGEMVRAILDGRKTQTRRVIIPQPQTHERGYETWKHGVFMVEYASQKCPYGRNGDLLWVRETWAAHEFMDDTKPSEFTESAQNTVRWYRADTAQLRNGRGKWRPSIFMPRWASRITLRVTNVRVERVQDISEADAKAEGLTKDRPGGWISCESYQMLFHRLWDGINAKRGYGWDANPWVWVVEFEVVR